MVVFVARVGANDVRDESGAKLAGMELRDATTVITGASGGIGQAIAGACRAAGSRLILSGRNEVALRTLASELDADVVVADLAKPDDVADLAANIGTAEVLVANAALPGAGAVVSFSTDEIDRLFDVNLRAPIVLSRLLADGIGVSRIHLGPIRDAGMWAETGVTMPGIRANSPHAVGAAVVRAIEHNRTHVTVAPVALRLGASLARVAPDLFARVAPGLGARRVTDQMVDALRDKR